MTAKASLLFAVSVATVSAVTQPAVDFNRDIRPIMSDTCFRCHGPDKSSRMMGMRLDLRDEATKPLPDGHTPIVPGDPGHSEIIKRIFEPNPARVMPPQMAHKTLTDAQKETIRRWVAEGAKYEGHWAYQPVKRPPVPALADTAQIVNPIDVFIQQRLAKDNLTPSLEADRHTLIRRVTFDLTGLPPTPAEVEAFEKDKSPDAYEKVVDRLLRSPAYAEEQARHWLDAVRYADTAGFHGDNRYPAWPYRDYVLRAFRDDMPFDEFTREQLAGDLMPNPTIDQKIASAYNRMNRVSAEGGLQPKEYIAKYGADRVRTLSAVWLGSTLGCAECHDHKFDPFKSKDFYSMKAFFADIKETGLVSDRGANAWGSKMSLPTPEQKQRLADLDAQLDAAKKERDAKAASLSRADWEKTILAQHDSGDLAWTFQRPIEATSQNGAKLTIYNDEPVDSNFYLSTSNGSTLMSEHKPGMGLVVASGPDPDNETYTVTFKPGAGTWTALGLEVEQDESLPGNRLARGSDRFLLTELDASVGKTKLVFNLATEGDSTGQMPENSPMTVFDRNLKTGWGISFGEARSPFLALRLAKPLTTDNSQLITVVLHHDSEYRKATIGRFRLALSKATYSWPENAESGVKLKARKGDEGLITTAAERGLPIKVQEALKVAEDKRTDDQKKLIANHFAWTSPELTDLNVKIAKLESARGILHSQIPEVMITEATEPAVVRILPRANWMDDTNEIVQPAVPGFLGKLDTGDHRATRLDLANWLVSPTNPLTARAFVNRQWRQFFGIGLSKAIEDLGSQGESPTHPELVDWLAAEFVQPTWQAAGTHPWDVRHILRTIVMSHTYRQSSLPNPQIDEKDTDDRLLARQKPFRVDAEVVHDTELAISGLLVDRFGGPSVRPLEPEGYLAAMNFPKREYSASHGDDLYRRGLYTEWQRTFLHPSLLNFDAPTREECVVNRVSSNTPLQALDLLNDPIFVEAARVFAQHILQNSGDLNKRINWAFEKAVNRAPTEGELAILTGLYQQSLSRFKQSPTDARQFTSIGESPVASKLKPVDLAAMTTVARAILNMHETITRN